MAVDERQIREKKALDASHADPANWKWGVFYHNPEDKRIFPPKRLPGIGWTTNFANRRSVWAMILLILIPIGLVELIIFLLSLKKT